MLIVFNSSADQILYYSTFQFSSVHDGIYALGKVHMRSTSSLRSFPNVAFETVPMLKQSQCLSTDDVPLSSFQGRSSSASSFHASLLQAIDDVMCFALCQQGISQAPQHFRSSETQTTCDDCFVSKSLCSVISLHSGMFRAGHPQEFSKKDAIRQSRPPPIPPVPVVNCIARSGTRGTSRWPSRHIYHRAGCELYSTVRNTWYLTMAFSSYISPCRL